MPAALLLEPAEYVILALYAVGMSLVHARWSTWALAATAAAMAAVATMRLVREARRVGRGTALRTFVAADMPTTATRLQRILAFPLAWAFFTFALAHVEPLGTAIMSAFGWAALLAISTISRIARSSRVVLGADGLRIERGRASRFLPYAEIASIADETPAVIETRSGERIALRVPAAAIEAAMTDAERTPRSVRPPSLARDGRAPIDWVRALRELGSGSDYRAARVPRDALWATLEDPAAAADARAAAAVALSKDLDTRERERLRVAADECAEPRVRVAATLAAGDAEEEALAEALAECDAR